jgi:hypothetical protein
MKLITSWNGMLFLIKRILMLTGGGRRLFQSAILVNVNTAAMIQNDWSVGLAHLAGININCPENMNTEAFGTDEDDYNNEPYGDEVRDDED